MTKIKVMIIDDEEIDRYLVTRTLTKFEVFGSIAEFADGSDAVVEFESPDFVDRWGPPPPTLVLLDINMPRMSGFDFLDYLEKDVDELAHWPSCVVLMLTSSSNMGDQEKAGGYDRVKGFIEKPITTEAVQAILDQHYRIGQTQPDR